MLEVDRSTPVLIGVGQYAERLGQPDYRAMSPAALAAEAASAALADTGTDPQAVLAELDTVAGVRQFDSSVPGYPAPLGRSENFPGSVAKRIGATPASVVLEVSGGQSPQHLVTEMAGSIAAGERSVVLLVGAEALATVAHLAGTADAPSFAEEVDGPLEDRGYGITGLVSRYAVIHGLDDAPTQYALLENARRSRLGLTRAEYAQQMGRLFAPFTEVAARNPFADAPEARSAEDLIEVTETNRVVSDPYPRRLIAREKVNQAAAVLLCSVEKAEQLGIPREKWVFLNGAADLRERDLLDRPDLGLAPAFGVALHAALAGAEVSLDQVSWLDLYSCFPIAVFAACDAVGLAPDDPRGLTVTGGLPFFGGPGNNYALHAIAEIVARARRTPGGYGLVGANGGILSKYSVGVYSTNPSPWRPTGSGELQQALAREPGAAHVVEADGWAVIETCTVKYGRSGPKIGVVVGRLEATGERFLAMTVRDDAAMLDLLLSDRPFGARIFVRSTAHGNRVAVDEQAMELLLPRPPAQLRDRYEYVNVARDGHLLEVTINRPEVRNALHPMANDELEHVFDCFFADPDLWVAILTGAGDAAFSAGNDLAYTGSGKPMWIPQTGYAGLTSRASMTKPVIAAVNGVAVGGGFETVLACHLVVADERARFGLPEVLVGLIAGAGGLVRLPRRVPAAVANEMVLTGKQIDATRAFELGLVNRLAPHGDALKVARELAQELAKASPTAIRVSIQVMAETAAYASVDDAVRVLSPALDELIFSDDFLEGPRAFAQKRTPQWRNR